MKGWVSGLSISILLLASAGGMAADPTPPAAAQAMERLQAEFPAVQTYQEGPRITRLYGQPFGYGTRPEDAAERFRVGHAEVFGVDPEDLQPVGPRGSDSGTLPVMPDRENGGFKFTLVSYGQFQDGVPVFRAQLRLLVREAENFPVVWAGSSLRPLGDFVPVLRTAVVRTDLAQAAVADEKLVTDFTGAVVAGPRAHLAQFSTPEMVIWAGVNDQVVPPMLAVTYLGESAPDAARPEKWLFVADAQTGEILYTESLIRFTDVTGNVQGMATEGAKAAFCSAEVPTPMPWDRVGISGGNQTNADGAGNFTIPNAGTTAVTVQSFMYGTYFTVDNVAGVEETLSMSVTPPGPANFMHNEANTDETVQAQVNAYVPANQVRDWVLAANPTYPTISTETGFPMYVNRTDGYCPGNAWSDGVSINFCLSGGGYPNTAWQSVVNHEYGHHVIDQGGSGQGQYGEGMADCHSMLPVDDPVLGYGFFGDCNTGLRNADNNYQYPCTGEIHDCGQLLSGCVWDTRNELVITEPVNYLSILSDLTVNSILLHDGDLITPQITIDFLTLDDTDGNIGNGTPHRTEICNGFGPHNMTCPAMDVGMSVGPASGFTSTGQAGGPFTPSSQVYTVQNLGPTAPISYEVTKTATWLTLTNATGTLATVGATAPVTVSINANANALPDGDYTDTVRFFNMTDHVGDTSRVVTLRVGINDDCAYAKRVCPGVDYTGNTAGMNVDGSTTCGTANASPDVWYKYTPLSSGTATFALCSGTSYDAVLSVHSAPCPGTSGTTLGCDDDGCGTTGGPSTVTSSVTASTTYLIRVSGWSGASGAYTLRVTGPDCEPVQPLIITFPNGVPSVVAPGTATSFQVRIQDAQESYVPGTGMLHYRYSGGAFQTAALSSLGGDLYQATLPSAMCAHTPQFYVSAQGHLGSTVTNPVNAPTGFYSALVGTLATLRDDTFETDTGWTRGDTGDNATTGLWDRADPEATAAQPEDDHTPAPGVNCWVTDHRAGGSLGEFDVDGGKTTLKSPVFDLSGVSNSKISYWRWYSNNTGGDPGNDTFLVDISNNGGSTWTRVETVGPTGPDTTGGWIYHEFLVSSVITPTSQMRMRFIAQDLGTGSLIEAALDDFKVTAFSCQDVVMPVLTGAKTWKTHGTGGSAQEFSIDLPIAAPYPAPGLPGVETRGGGITKLTFTFDQAITLPPNPTDVARMYGVVNPGPYAPVSATLAGGGTTLVTTWSGVPNTDRYVVCLNVAGLTGDSDVEIIGQVGNVQLTPPATQVYTDGYDLTAIGPYLGQAATQANCKYDITQVPAPSSKMIDGSDKSALAGSYSGPVATTPSTCP